MGRYRGAASAALDAAGRLSTVDVVGVTAGYLHYWSPRWSSNVVVSPAWVVSELGDPATSNDSFNYVAVNLLYWLIDRRAWVGGEYLYGRGSCGTAYTGPTAASSWRHASTSDRHLGLMSPWPGPRYRSA